MARRGQEWKYGDQWGEASRRGWWFGPGGTWPDSVWEAERWDVLTFLEHGGVGGRNKAMDCGLCS